MIEAIVENVAAKQALFAQLAKITGPGCVLASNTSALPIEELSAGAEHPGRILGLHFFNPVGRMPLVELVLSPHTTRERAERALAFVKVLGKTPVVCRSSPGFLVTRVLFFYLNEACRLWESGVPTETIDRAMREWGWPMGPMRLIDEVGVDVTDFIFGEMKHYFPDRFAGTTVCARMLAAGLKGRKNGASSGFYVYTHDGEVRNTAMAEFAPKSATSMDAAAIAEKLNGVMIAETKRVLAEGVLKTADDADLALLLGAGFPAWRGGLMRYARSTADLVGAQSCASGIPFEGAASLHPYKGHANPKASKGCRRLRSGREMRCSTPGFLGIFRRQTDPWPPPPPSTRNRSATCC